ncbi:crinkler family protein [Gigaspora margarita]|uniref:Crinkler family protein n=1 Tax=Gigaspora margarita TaxID=4874 RepID=A0A8H3X0Q6_GIGMA|nr:crinkler family protein [Gigaspora margarita]
MILTSAKGSAKGLIPLINEPLLGKLPATCSEEHKYPILSKVVCTNKEDCQSEIAIYISYILTEKFGYEVLNVKSEDMMHQIIDNLIMSTFTLFSHHNNKEALQIEFIRNSTSFCYPDFLLYNNNVLVFKGEENPCSDMYNDALGDLSEKFYILDPVFFGDMKFLICYAVAGWKIGFYAIDGMPEAASMPSRLVHLTDVFDLRLPYHQIKVISSIINIIRVLLTISPILPTDIIPIGRPLRLQQNSIITFDYTSVTKEVPIENLPYADDVNARVKFLSSMYACARGCLSLVQVAEDSLTVCQVGRKKMYQLVMKTRGKRATPKEELQLKIMTKNVLVGLECLHEEGFVHRDIRMPNILYVTSDNPANSSYVLIDFLT